MSSSFKKYYVLNEKTKVKLDMNMEWFDSYDILT
jgi:hypothetical protein